MSFDIMEFFPPIPEDADERTDVLDIRPDARPTDENLLLFLNGPVIAAADAELFCLLFTFLAEDFSALVGFLGSFGRGNAVRSSTILTVCTDQRPHSQHRSPLWGPQTRLLGYCEMVAGKCVKGGKSECTRTNPLESTVEPALPSM